MPGAPPGMPRSAPCCWSPARPGLGSCQENARLPALRLPASSASLAVTPVCLDCPAGLEKLMGGHREMKDGRNRCLRWRKD